MPSKPVQISMDTELLRLVDADPEVRDRGRSAFIRAAVRAYLEGKQRRQIDQQISAAYEGHADAMLSEVAEFLEEQEWPRS